VDGRGIPAEARRFLYENDPKGLAELERYQTTTARGEEPETDYAVLEDLLAQFQRDPRGFADVDLTKYRNQLSDRHYEELTRYKAGNRGAKGTQLSPYFVNQFKFSEAKRYGLIGQNVQNVNGLKARGEEFQRYEAVSNAIDEALRDARTANPNITGEQELELMRGILSRQSVVDVGFRGFRTDTMPTAAVLPNERVIGEVTDNTATIRAGILQLGGTVTDAKVTAIAALMNRTDLNAAQKRAEAERIARGR